MLRILLTSLLLIATQVQAGKLEQANFAQVYKQQALELQRKSQAVLVYLWVDVYAAAFYGPAGQSASEIVDRMNDQRLELHYFRDISRGDVIKAAWVALKRQHTPTELDALHSQIEALHAAFRDIRTGDRYALTHRKEGGLTLEINGQSAYTSNNPDLARAYLGIWLRPNGLSDKLRNELLQGH